MNLLNSCVYFVKASVFDFKEAMEFKSRGAKYDFLFFIFFNFFFLIPTMWCKLMAGFW